MKLSTIVFRALSSVSAATPAYAVPPGLLALTQDAPGNCILPVMYFIRDFAGHSGDAGATVSTFDFHYRSVQTGTETLCHFNATSVSTTPAGLTPRFSCDNRDVKFIWQDENRVMFMIERVCPNNKGIPQYEVSGSVVVPVACDAATGMCTASPTELKTRFTSIHVVLDPTSVMERE